MSGPFTALGKEVLANGFHYADAADETAAAKIAATLNGGGWQGIASAPRDGSEIVGWDEASGTKHVTWWDYDRWHDPDSHYYSEAPVFEPTLFCTLPDAPTTPSTEGQGA